MKKCDVHGLAVNAASTYQKELKKTSKLTESEVFDKAAACFQAGYERALMENIEFEDDKQ